MENLVVLLCIFSFACTWQLPFDNNDLLGTPFLGTAVDSSW